MPCVCIKRKSYGLINHLILEELPEWLDQRELQILGQTPDVVMRFDRVAVLLIAPGRGAGLNHVRVPERKLRVEKKRSKHKHGRNESEDGSPSSYYSGSVMSH